MGRWRGGGERQLPPYFEICCSCECHSPVSFLAAEGASGRAWVTSGPGLSHHQRPGCPATRKGTKGTFDVQGPPLAHSPVLSSRPGEHSSRSPTPRPSFLLPEQSQADSARPPQGMSPSCTAEAWPLSAKERLRGGCFSGDFSSPPRPQGAPSPRDSQWD